MQPAYIWFAKKGKLEKRNQCYANTLSIVRWWSVTVAKTGWRLTLTFWAATVVGATGSRAVWSLNASRFRWLIHLNSGCLDLFLQDFFKWEICQYLAFAAPRKTTLNIPIPTQLSSLNSLFIFPDARLCIQAETFGSFSFRSLLLYFTATGFHKRQQQKKINLKSPLSRSTLTGVVFCWNIFTCGQTRQLWDSEQAETNAMLGVLSLSWERCWCHLWHHQGPIVSNRQSARRKEMNYYYLEAGPSAEKIWSDLE